MTDPTSSRTAEQRVAELGLDLPSAPTPAAAYLPSKQVGQLLYLSGQVPFIGGALERTGRLVDDIDLDTGIACARQCAINALAVLRAALGTLDRVTELVNVTIYVAATSGFTDPHTRPLRHRRRHLPLAAPVEVEITALVHE